MLEYLLLALAALAVWHLIADGIFAADIALLTRAQAANAGACLDSLREARPEIDRRAYHVLRESLVGLVQHPAAFSPSALWTATHRLHRDKDMQRQFAERMAILESVSDADLAGYRRRISELAVRTFRCNSAGWAIYLVPIGVAHGMYRKIQGGIKSLLAMPEQVANLDAGSPPAYLGNRWVR